MPRHIDSTQITRVERIKTDFFLLCRINSFYPIKIYPFKIRAICVPALKIPPIKIKNIKKNSNFSFQKTDI